MKIALVYYSMSGNTEFVAQKISQSLKCDLIKLKPVKEYPDSGFKKFFWGGKSALMKEMPKLCKYTFDASKYDKLIIGTPVWASNYNPTIRTFINNHKDVIGEMEISVFICCSGVGSDKVINKLKNDLGIEKFAAELVLIDPKDKETDEKNREISEFIKKVG